MTTARHVDPAAGCPIELSCTDPNHRRPLVTIETTDPAPTPPEVLREQVARELWTTGLRPSVYGRTPWEDLGESTRDDYRRLADAALAVFRGQQDPAVQRVLALCEIADTAVRSTGMVQTDAIRAAIGGDGR